MRTLIVILTLFILQSCSNKLPNTSKLESISPFWQSFTDQKLNALVDEAMKSNSDVLTAMVNVNKAQSLLKTSEANRLPSVSLQASASRSRDSENLSSTFVHEPYSTFGLSTVLSYQIDLWGKVANANKAAKSQLLSLSSSKANVKITIASEVTKAYFAIIALDEKIKLNKKLIELATKAHELTIKKFKQGSISNFEVQQAASSLHLAKSKLLNLEQELVVQEYALKALVGKDKMTDYIERNKSLDSLIIPKTPNRLPSNLLLRRPDVMAAEHMLEASKYQVKVARASLFPEISLNNLLGFGSNDLNNLLNSSKSWQRSFGATASTSLLDFGKKGNNLDFAKAEESQAIIDYKKAIRDAFAEAIIGLNAEKKSNYNLIQVKAHEMAMAEIYHMSNKQFKAGMINALDLINSEKAFIAAKNDKIDALHARLNSVVDMFKALGGEL